MFINGTTIEIPETVGTIQELLIYLKLQDKMVIVEQNGVILQKEDYSQVVKSTDTIEIVTFVGGG
ncbi:sulfur carrier protein ThiS [Rummeliibacillus suwonensis]|jgi:sulfur carrier protein|uniref:sulfur carrier protein ThiS n=1 Tax=Rummeliibacillus suwonensis TaxID=1306154 RepID=UPI0011B702E5|nr:sulfur carrier protein ThiS [Rummeliibacillus suwonensis]MBO2535878.1 sulfur carrier protein ThiS [Rummeliibacillus suwonensis]